MLSIGFISTKKAEKLLPLVILVFIVILLFLVRFILLNKNEAPPGSDVANHLTVLHAYQDNDVTSLAPQERYPPIYFFLVLLPLLQVFPTFIALKFSMAFTSSIIAIPFFFLAKNRLRDDVLSLLLAFIFAFAEGYSDMIGWGGIPNFLGIFFMLVSIFFFLKMIENESSRDAVFSGVFLGLVFGTHHLTALYYFIVLIITLTLLSIFCRKLLVVARKPLAVFLIIGVISSIPFFPIYIAIFSQRAHSSIQTNPWRIHELFANIPSDIYLFFGEILFIWIVIAVLGFALLWREKRRGKILFRTLASSLTIAAFFLLLIIPEHPTRPLYFLYVPLTLLFGLCIYEAHEYIRRLTRLTKSSLTKYIKYTSVIFLVLFTTSFLVTTSYLRLSKAIDYYYTLDSEVVKALNWIKENTEQDAVIVLAEKSWGWWVEGYCERKAFIAADSKLFMYEQQRHQVDIANRIFSGFHVLENNYLRVSDNFPYNLGNPTVFVNLGTLYQELFFFDEANSAKFAYSPVGDPASLKEISLRVMENKTVNAQPEDEGDCISYVYSWVDGTVIRSTRLVEGSSCLEVNFTMSTTGSFYKRANITLSISPYVDIIDQTIENNVVDLTLENPLQDVFNAQITVTEPSSVNINFQEQSSSFTPNLLFRTLPTKEDLQIQLQVKIEPKIASTTGETTYFNTYQLIDSNSVDLLLIKVGTLRDFEKFFLDSMHFTYIDIDTRSVVLFRWNG